MFDCVFPTRTAVRPWAGGRWGSLVGDKEEVGLGRGKTWVTTFACLLPQRFGSALVPTGTLQLKKKQYEKDFRPIDPACACPTCQK